MTVNTVVGVPNQPKTPLRSMRISEDLWSKAQARAKHDRETVTDVIRRALEDYTEGWEPEDDSSR